MSKKILVFADGTGNVGGLLPDESRTNVYKLYRATRTGPDSTIDPAKQIAFYIQGIGTVRPGKHSRFFGAREIGQQAIGRGLKQRIVECYAAIMSVWQPGDTIYLFGFSRGAYTARCVAHILELFGIPTRQPGSDTLSLDPKQLKKIASRAASVLYRFGLKIDDTPQRQAKVDRFISDYAPHRGKECGAIPYFMGLWDSVAAYGLGQLFESKYDKHLPYDVQFTRHALSIDERRYSFKRAHLGGTNRRPKEVDEPDPLQQVWFAGNHCDIGGNYPENESRLSDISLSWMVEFVTKRIPEGYRLELNPNVLNLYPCASGMMHDECQRSRIWFLRALRDVPEGATIHKTVVERMNLPTVREYGGYHPYRPEQLRKHPKVAHHYPPMTEADEMLRLNLYQRIKVRIKKHLPSL